MNLLPFDVSNTVMLLRPSCRPASMLIYGASLPLAAVGVSPVWEKATGVQFNDADLYVCGAVLVCV